MIPFVRHVAVKLWEVFVLGILNSHLSNRRIPVRESS